VPNILTPDERNVTFHLATGSDSGACALIRAPIHSARVCLGMDTNMKSFRLLAATALASSSFFVASAAYAQDVAPQASEEDAAEGAIIVTGSRIARPNLESTVPITSIPGEQFFETGQVAIGDVLNELPALRSTYSQSNSTRFLGTAGLNLLDLRGLGTQRTLVLVNGRRHVAADILNNGVSPDTNTFPTDLIDRVDIVTGGNSAVYGSDAIAGVVNFILKKDFEGYKMRAQGGTSRYGDATAFFVSGLAGWNFGEGRGNIAINAEYAHQNEYYARGRPFERQDAFIVVDTDPAGSVNGSDGNPDRLFFTDVRSATLNNTGLVRFGGNARLSCGTDAAGALFNCPFAFAPDGTLAPVTGTRIGIGPNGSFQGGNGENFRTNDQFQLSPKLDRYNVNLLAHYTVSDAFEPFIEAKYARTEVFGTGNSGPAFITGTTLGDSREAPRLNNPFLSAQARTLITQQLTLANGVAPAANARFSLRENMTGLGKRAEQSERETYRGVVGVRGKFNDDWNYEVSANYGEFKERTKVLGNLNIQRFLLAMDAVTDPSTGNIVCNSRINAAAKIPYVDASNAQGVDSILDADVAACTPVNPFGGQFTQAQRDYLLANTTSVGKITQFVASAFVSGDLSQLFELPGGPVGFAIGAEYRRETNAFKADPLVEQGYTFYNALPTFTSPAFEVKEVYGELRVPIFAETPFFHELTLNGSGRIADYKGGTGTVYAYSGGIDWAPVKDLRFRANYSRSVRAPNLSELFSAPGQNFAPAFNDPCSARNVGTGSATRAANCTAAGAPAGYDFVYSQSLAFVSGGNPNLSAETSDSYTVGGVFQPSFVPGLSLSVDYYDITVNKVISSVAAQTIVDQCYDQPTLNNVFCSSFQRNTTGGTLPTGEVPFQIIEGSLLQSALNFAKLKARGIDAELAYRREIGGLGTFNSRLVYTHVFQRDNFLNPAQPNFANRLLTELGDPQDEFSLNTSLKVGNVTFGYDLRYVGKQVLNTFEDFSSLQGRAPENADYANRMNYPAVFYHDIRLGADVNEKFNIYLGRERFQPSASVWTERHWWRQRHLRSAWSIHVRRCAS
jgi:outer membrane receptor protein involved in Fe transport